MVRGALRAPSTCGVITPQGLQHSGFKRSGASIIRLALALVFTATLAACSTAPIYNVAPTKIANPTPLETDRIANAIRLVGGSLDWRIREHAPGHLIAVRIDDADRMAQIDIHYDRYRYSIEYLDSRNFEQSGNRIHNDYNRWIDELETAIHLQLARM